MAQVSDHLLAFLAMSCIWEFWYLICWLDVRQSCNGCTSLGPFETGFLELWVVLCHLVKTFIRVLKNIPNTARPIVTDVSQVLMVGPKVKGSMGWFSRVALQIREVV